MGGAGRSKTWWSGRDPHLGLGLYGERDRPAVSTACSVARAMGPRSFLPEGLAGAGRARLADPHMARVRKQGAGHRGPAAQSGASPNRGDRGPCGSLTLLRRAPERGRGHRVLECSPGVSRGPKQTVAAPEVMARKTPSPTLAPLCSMDAGAGTRGQRGPTRPHRPGLKNEPRLTVCALCKAGDHCPPWKRVLTLPLWRGIPGGPPRTGSLARCLRWAMPGARPGFPRTSQSLLTREPKETSRALLQQPRRLPKSLGVWCMRQELCPLQPQETAAPGGWSNHRSLNGTEAPDATGLTSTILPGAQDPKGGSSRPQGHAGGRRHPPSSPSGPATRPTFPIPCTWDGSGVAVGGQDNAVGTTSVPSPSSTLEPEPLPGLGFVDKAHGACRLPPGPESSTHLSWGTPRPEPGAQGPLKDTRRQGFLSQGAQGAVPGGGVGRSAGRTA